MSRTVARPNIISTTRQTFGYTQQQLAEHVGCTQAAISRIESGDSPGSLSTLVGIAHILDIPLSQITQITQFTP